MRHILMFPSDLQINSNGLRSKNVYDCLHLPTLRSPPGIWRLGWPGFFFTSYRKIQRICHQTFSNPPADEVRARAAFTELITSRDWQQQSETSLGQEGAVCFGRCPDISKWATCDRITFADAWQGASQTPRRWGRYKS